MTFTPPQAPSFSQFFGDGELEFSLTPELIAELERKAGVGIGAISKRLIAGQFYLADIAETIRLGLIGGGMSPEHAASYTHLYCLIRPIAETLPLALSIFECAFFGAPADDNENPEVAGNAADYQAS